MSHRYDDQNRLFRKFGTNVLFLKSCSALWLHNGWLLRLHVHVCHAVHFMLPNYFGDTVTRMSFKMCGCAKFFHSVTIQNKPSDYQDYTYIEVSYAGYYLITVSYVQTHSSWLKFKHRTIIPVYRKVTHSTVHYNKMLQLVVLHCMSKTLKQWFQV